MTIKNNIQFTIEQIDLMYAYAHGAKIDVKAKYELRYICDIYPHLNSVLTFNGNWDFEKYDYRLSCDDASTKKEIELKANIKYRKKSIIIEAVQWDGNNLEEIKNFTSALDKAGIGKDQEGKFIVIPTLEGNISANIGDWIIKGIKGKFYPCKPDFFESTYEKIEMNSQDSILEKWALVLNEQFVTVPLDSKQKCLELKYGKWENAEIIKFNYEN